MNGSCEGHSGWFGNPTLSSRAIYGKCRASGKRSRLFLQTSHDMKKGYHFLSLGRSPSLPELQGGQEREETH
jgi:hypothetical protein